MPRERLARAVGHRSLLISATEITSQNSRLTGCFSVGKIGDTFFGSALLENNFNNFAVRQLPNGRTYINSYNADLTFRKTNASYKNAFQRKNGDMTFYGSTLRGDI